MKILILRFSSIGDIVLTTPVVRCIKKKFPDAAIHYATKKAFLPIVQHNPYIQNVHVLNTSLFDLINELKQEKFDHVIDLHNNQRTFLIKLFLARKSRSFDKLNFEKWLMVNFKINRLPAIHIVDRYLDAACDLDVSNDGDGLDYFIAPEEEVSLQILPDGFQNGYVGWVIGAKHNTKRFPSAKIKQTISQVQYPVVLIGGKEDSALAEKITSSLKGLPIHNACGKYSLNQSASLVKQARLVVTNDTGMMHIAAAFKKPLISLWGNTIPEFGMYPYFGNHAVKNGQFEINGLDCRPCSKLGYGNCPLGHFNCMNMIEDSALVNKIKSLFTA